MPITMSMEELLSLPTIGASGRVDIIAEFLKSGLGNVPGRGFMYLAPLCDLDRSIRMFGVSSFDGSVPLPRLYRPEDMAYELMRLSLTDEARYPKQGYTLNASKGWTILKFHKCDDGANPIVAAYATWIP